MNTTKILHLSDLHFGNRFSESKWSALNSHVERSRPDAVVITGDLVNSPWRWELKAAKTRLDQLAAALNPSGKAQKVCEIFLVPGNHDTRILGLVAVDWLEHVALIFLILSNWFAWSQSFLPATLLFAPALFLCVLRGLVSSPV